MEPDPKLAFQARVTKHALIQKLMPSSSLSARGHLPWRSPPASLLVSFAWAAVFLMLEGLLLVVLPWPIRFAVDELFVPIASGGAVPRAPVLSRLFAEVATELPQDTLHWLSTFSNGAAYLLFIVFGMATLIILYGLVSRAGESLKIRSARRVLQMARVQLLRSIVTREQTFIDSRHKEDLKARLTADLNDIDDFISNVLNVVCYDVAMLAMALLVMGALDLRLTLILAGALPVVYSATGYFARYARLSEKKREGDEARMEREFSQLLGSLPSLKSLAAEKEALDSISQRSERFDDRSSTAQRAEVSMRILRLSVKNLLRTLVLLVGGRGVLAGELTLGGLALFFFYAEILNHPISEISAFMAHLNRWRAAVSRVEKLHAELEGHEEHEGRQNISSLPFPDATALHFENVHFGFENTSDLIAGLTADFKAGELIAVTGPSGSGKSIFAKLTNRLFDPTQGKISLGKTDLRRYKLKLLRNTVRVQLPDPFFIPGTIRENVLLGSEEIISPSDEVAIADALRAAQCDFVQALPQILDTRIGEGGLTLSRIELKKLSLARIFLHQESRVVVLDEPLRDLDTRASETVSESIETLAENGALVFWITSRYEDLLLADRVLFFDGHTPVPHLGTHEELLGVPAYKSFVPGFARQMHPGLKDIKRRHPIQLRVEGQIPKKNLASQIEISGV